MDWMGLWLVIMGMGLIALIFVMARATYMRMTGRRTLDSAAETMVRAQGAAVYPPTLRGDPVPQIVEEIEVSRSARAERDTPADEESR
jgi:hypothetical protein